MNSASQDISMHLYVPIPMKTRVDVESIEQRLSEEEEFAQSQVDDARGHQTFILISLNRDALDQGDESKISQDLDSIGVESWVVYGEYDILVSIVLGLAVEVLYDFFKYLHRQMKRRKIRSMHIMPATKLSETNEKHKQETDSKKNLKKSGKSEKR